MPEFFSLGRSGSTPEISEYGSIDPWMIIQKNQSIKNMGDTTFFEGCGDFFLPLALEVVPHLKGSRLGKNGYCAFNL